MQVWCDWQLTLCDPHLSALEVRFSRRCAIQIDVYLYLYDSVCGADTMTRVIASVHPVHLMNVVQRQAATDSQTSPPARVVNPPLSAAIAYIHHRHLVIGL